MTDKQTISEFEYKAEMKQLLHLIIHSLYTHPEIFLRELISNASDALNKARFLQLTDRDNLLDASAPLQIKIHVDPDEHTFSIEDTGVGMTEDDLINRIGTVASSGTRAFLDQVRSGEQPVDGLIGQFGVGFYSVFMVTDEVTIETRHAATDSKGYRWQSVGEGRFTIEEIDRAERGTKISFKLNEKGKEFAQTWRIKQIIKKYSNFVDFPILVNDEEVNSVSALWHRNKSEVTDEEYNEFYKFLTNDSEPPLGRLHLALEGMISFKALLFIPSKPPFEFFRGVEPKNLHLYARRVFIQDDAEVLMPDYLTFISGVVDAEDLPLNVSREVTQSSPLLAKIKDILTKRILDLIEDWAKNDEETYNKFYEAQGPLFMTGINSDFKNRDRIVELLRFRSTLTEADQRTSLKDYVARMPFSQKEIYYLAGEHRDVVERNPHLEYFRKKGLEVLLLTDPVEVFIAPFLGTYDEKPVKSIESQDLDFQEDEEQKTEALSEEASKDILAAFKETLGDRVAGVAASKRLVDSAVTLVAPEGGMGAQMERMMKMMDENYQGTKKILEINLGHPVIKNLAELHANSDEADFVRDSILQLFEGALLIDGNLTATTAFVARMTKMMERATGPA